MMRRPKMVHWYTPRLAARTGIRVALSSVFGTFADRREIFSGTNPIRSTPFDAAMDYNKANADGAFWLDYMSDTGDGFDATYSMARMLSAPELEVEGAQEPLSRGRVLVLGGDQVYPDPSRQDYLDRLVGPFEAAQADQAAAKAGREADLYAIPGNHDWYDGLVSFSGLFCRRRVSVDGQATLDRPGRNIADWNTQQTRSYFALKLPGNWWFWGCDTQLSGYVDKPQIEYFAYAARHWMAPGSNVIVAMATPAWVGAGAPGSADSFRFFDYATQLAEVVESPEGEPMGHKVKLVLTGDHHHYARYEQEDTGRNLIICGGGGAFLHPTHHLTEQEHHQFEQGEEVVQRRYRLARREGGEEALYPPREASRRLTWWNLLFPFLNPGLTISYILAYLFFVWTLSAWSVAIDGATLYQKFVGVPWGEALRRYSVLVAGAPFNVFLIAISFAAYFYFCGKAPLRQRFLIGGVHWLAQTFAALGVGWVTMQPVSDALANAGLANWLKETVVVVASSAASGVASAFVLGLYLLVSLNLFGRHFNEAFSSIRVDRFRSFLRLRIGADGRLCVFPVGLHRVPRPAGKSSRLEPELIEPPIFIDP